VDVGSPVAAARKVGLSTCINVASTTSSMPSSGQQGQRPLRPPPGCRRDRPMGEASTERLRQSLRFGRWRPPAAPASQFHRPWCARQITRQCPACHKIATRGRESEKWSPGLRRRVARPGQRGWAIARGASETLKLAIHAARRDRPQHRCMCVIVHGGCLPHWRPPNRESALTRDLAGPGRSTGDRRWGAHAASARPKRQLCRRSRLKSRRPSQTPLAALLKRIGPLCLGRGCFSFGLTACGGAQAQKPPTIKREDLATIQRQAKVFLAPKDRLPELGRSW